MGFTVSEVSGHHSTGLWQSQASSLLTSWQPERDAALLGFLLLVRPEPVHQMALSTFRAGPSPKFIFENTNKMELCFSI